MRRLELPFIPGLESLDYEQLDLALDMNGAKGVVDSVNWPEEFPYRPDCIFAAARSESHLVVMYHVRGLDLRAAALEDNGPVWEDSCCEFFVSDPSDGTYYNFEMNCIGTLLAAKRKSRKDCRHFSADQLARVRRFSTLKHRSVELSDKIFGWSVGMAIPFDLIGIDPAALPGTLRANFFKCGDKTAHVHFLSWNPIDCPKPDFHRPQDFGEIIFK